MGKKRNNKKLLVLVMSLTILSALLGTSYANWSKTTIIDTQIASGKIAATGAVEKKYIMCANVNCTSGDKHRQKSSIQLQLEQGSIPIEVRKVEILKFEYTAEIWRGENVKVWSMFPPFYRYVWEWRDRPEYQTVILTDTVKNIPCTYQKDKNNCITILVGKEGKGDLQIKNEMPQIWSGHRPSNRPNWADVYVGNIGKLTFRITYTQFNTKNAGGWEKTIDVEVPVSWYRWDQEEEDNKIFPENGNQSIRPGEEGEF